MQIVGPRSVERPTKPFVVTRGDLEADVRAAEASMVAKAEERWPVAAERGQSLLDAVAACVGLALVAAVLLAVFLR